MRQFLTIAGNTFMELVRQPIFLLLTTSSAAFIVFLAAVPYFGFGEDPKLVKDSGLAVMLLSGLFCAVLSASASVAQEIRSGTALAVLAKPIGRARFLLAKYVGLAGALSVLTYVNLVSALVASRMAFDAYGETDTKSLGIFFGALAGAYAAAGFGNYFLRRTFVADAVLILVIMVTAAAVIVSMVNPTDRPFREDFAMDWRLLPAAILILFALWILAGLALACSTRFEVIPTLAICSGVFLLGLMSDYLFAGRAQPDWLSDVGGELSNPNRTEAQKALLREFLDRYDGDRDGRLGVAERAAVSAVDQRRLVESGMKGEWWASVLYTVIPNWQLFWLADALEGKNHIPWAYVGRASGYVAGYLGAALALALFLFTDRELT